MIISVINLKGGVGKTITAINLAHALARAGQRVLLVDVDLQHSTTSYFDIDTRGRPTVMDVFFNGFSLSRAAVEVRPNLRVVPSVPDVQTADARLAFETGGELRLKKGARAPDWDYCLIDCPSGWGAVAKNAALASTHALVPVNSEPSALASAVDTVANLEQAADIYDREHLQLGVLLTMERSSGIAASVARGCRQQWPEQTLRSTVRRNEWINHLSALGKTVFEGNAGSARDDYQQLCQEVMQRWPKAN
jgi:chromosome partitioning protein